MKVKIVIFIFQDQAWSCPSSKASLTSDCLTLVMLPLSSGTKETLYVCVESSGLSWGATCLHHPYPKVILAYQSTNHFMCYPPSSHQQISGILPVSEDILGKTLVQSNRVSDSKSIPSPAAQEP